MKTFQTRWQLVLIGFGMMFAFLAVLKTGPSASASIQMDECINDGGDAWASGDNLQFIGTEPITGELCLDDRDSRLIAQLNPATQPVTITIEHPTEAHLRVIYHDPGGWKYWQNASPSIGTTMITGALPYGIHGLSLTDLFEPFENMPYTMTVQLGAPYEALYPQLTVSVSPTQIMEGEMVTYTVDYDCGRAGICNVMQFDPGDGISLPLTRTLSSAITGTATFTTTYVTQGNWPGQFQTQYARGVAIRYASKQVRVNAPALPTETPTATVTLTSTATTATATVSVTPSTASPTLTATTLPSPTTTVAIERRIYLPLVPRSSP